MDAALLQALERYASFAVLAALAVAAIVIRSRTRDEMLRADVKGAVVLLLAALAARVAHRVALQLDAPATVLHVVALSLAAFGAIRLGAGVTLWVIRLRGTFTPKILRDVIDATLYLVAVALILRSTFEIDLASFVTTSALLSIVLGLALQDTLGNLFAGLSLQIERPFSRGDWIQTEQHTGRVLEVSWRAVKIQTRRGEVVTMPNGTLAKGLVINYSRRPGGGIARELVIGLAYGAPPNLVKQTLTAALAHPLVLADPAPEVQLTGYGDSSIQYRIRYWLADFEAGQRTDDELYSAIWYRLQRAGLEIPFPIRTVHLKRTRAAAKDELRAAHDGNVLTPENGRDALSSIDFLAPLGPGGLGQLAAKCHRDVYGQGETIVRRGDPGDSFYVVVEGSVDVLAAESAQPIARLVRGAFFGEMSLLTDEPRSATVVAATDVAVLTVDRIAFSEVLQQNPSIGEALAAVLAERRAGLAAAAVGAEGERASQLRAETGRIFTKLRDIFHLR